jgi:signal transduction histidine kinase
LEAVAAGLQTDPVAVQAQAGIEARRLRQALALSSLDSESDLEPPTGLDRGLSALAAEFSELGLDCAITLSVSGGLDGSRVEALLDATREALRNVLKHSGVNRVVVSCVESDGGVKVTIRDQGKGFSPDQVARGFGLTQSVHGRLDDVDGRADVWSEPGRGTRITLWAPT